uniref:Uncharacterized protein n=1 Tax=Spongospora subterranea TaxID=70186 RepID=A0A0H5QGX3_9EUKA|eukprot:CRZ01248.1 hypothetical protein [Spongospora subterranea]
MRSHPSSQGLWRWLHKWKRAILIFLFTIAFTIVVSMEAKVPPPNQSELSLLQGKKILIAANYYENEAILESHMRQLFLFVSMIRSAGAIVFVSIYENGSHDSTPALLNKAKQRLRAQDIPHRVLNERIPSWRSLKKLQKPENEEEVEFRIKFMAKCRNKALEPLAEHDFDTIVFLNDVIFDAHDAVRLVLTDGMQYDTVCGMDFNRVTFYDTWVSRDINGESMSGFFPFVVDAESAELLKQGKPFPVSSCWNGIVAIRAAALGGTRFRSWRTNETRSKFANEHQIYDGSCPVSECTLLFGDMAQKGFENFFINPTVHVTYTHADWVWHRLFGGLLNTLAPLFLCVEAHPRAPAWTRVPSCDFYRTTHFRIWPHLIWFVAVVSLAISKSGWHRNFRIRLHLKRSRLVGKSNIWGKNLHEIKTSI